MGLIQQLKKFINGVETDIYPVTSPDAVRDSQGESVTEKINKKQDTLVSGTNIKTINGESVLGSGDIEINPMPFIAEYGETSRTEIKEALNSGKQVLCSITLPDEEEPDASHPFLLPLVEPNPSNDRFVFSGIIYVDTYLYIENFDGRWDYVKSPLKPSEYLKSASVSNNTLTLTKKDNTTVVFSPEKDTLIITTETPFEDWLPYVGQKNIIFRSESISEPQFFYLTRIILEDALDFRYIFTAPADSSGQVEVMTFAYDTSQTPPETNWYQSSFDLAKVDDLVHLEFDVFTPLEDVRYAAGRNMPIIWDGCQAVNFVYSERHSEISAKLVFVKKHAIYTFDWDNDAEEWASNPEFSLVDTTMLYDDYYNKPQTDAKLAEKANANLVPAQASTSNQLADKNFVNSSINALAAFYISSNAAGDAFSTKAALLAGPYYKGGVLRTPTKNDYAIVLADESKGNATTRYSYDGSVWAYQYKVNDTPLTAAQLAALNSGITAALVGQIGEKEIAYVTTANTFAQVLALYNAGKHIIYRTGIMELPMVRKYVASDTVETLTFLFSATFSNAALYNSVVLNKYSGWSALYSDQLEMISNKETTLTPTSTSHYPSSKAVADYVAEETEDVVRTSEQSLTDEEKEQARENIGAQEALTPQQLQNIEDVPGKAEKTLIVTPTAGQAAYFIDANKITNLGELASAVTLSLNAGEIGKANIYDIIFSTGATAPTITWPNGITWAGGSAPTINASKTYEVSISEGLALCVEY